MSRESDPSAATATPLPISQRDNAFVIERDGARLAEMTYRRAGDVITIVHTGVTEALKGQGAGKRLVEAAVRWARAEHLRIEPRCSFARSVFDKEPALRDVLATG